MTDELDDVEDVNCDGCKLPFDPRTTDHERCKHCTYTECASCLDADSGHRRQHWHGGLCQCCVEYLHDEQKKSGFNDDPYNS